MAALLKKSPVSAMKSLDGGRVAGFEYSSSEVEYNTREFTNLELLNKLED